MHAKVSRATNSNDSSGNGVQSLTSNTDFSGLCVVVVAYSGNAYLIVRNR